MGVCAQAIPVPRRKRRRSDFKRKKFWTGLTRLPGFKGEIFDRRNMNYMKGRLTEAQAIKDNSQSRIFHQEANFSLACLMSDVPPVKNLLPSC
jgi:hypothetical protein